MRNLAGYDEWADVTHRMAALGAVRHHTPSIYVPGKGYYHQEQQQYTLAEDISYTIAVFGLKAAEENIYWYTNHVGHNLSVLCDRKLFGTNVTDTSKYILPYAADYLEQHGYARSVTAKTLCVYSHYLDPSQPVEEVTAAVAHQQLLNCADLVQLPGLTFEEQIDAGRRQLNAKDLHALLQEGASYMLAKELFKAPEGE